jgi:N-acetylglucosamine-6-phosphate deacetylase
MLIKNGTVLDKNFKFIEADLLTNENKIEEIGALSGSADIYASDCYVVPGFVDTHMHAAVGKKFIDYDEDTFRSITTFEAKNGTTSLVPALSAAPKEKLLACIDYMKKCCTSNDEDAAKCYGIHLEGPFFSEKYKGAHLPENIRDTDPAELMDYIKAAEGFLKIITLAPELPNADETIKLAVENGVCVSLGHSNATYEEALHAIELGASQGTHLFNAMTPLNHRNPGVVGAILFSDAKPEVICDFFHVHKDVVKMVYDLKGADKINMITDSELGAGFPDGVYDVNGRKIIIKDRKTYTEDGTIAGGTSVLHDGILNLVSIGIPLEDACKMASKNPAESVGIFDKVGSLDAGKLADIVILNKSDLSIKHVILRGNLLL